MYTDIVGRWFPVRVVEEGWICRFDFAFTRAFGRAETPLAWLFCGTRERVPFRFWLGIEIRPRAGDRGRRGQVLVCGVKSKGAGRVRVVGAA